MSHNVAIRERDVPFAQFDCLAPSRTDQFLLLREMHHRFANSLMTLTAILRRELRSPSSSSREEVFDRCEARIVALAELQRRLMVGAAPGWVSVVSYIEHLCKTLAEAILGPLGVRCEVAADAALLPSECCELLGLVIAELVTNAAKHAFRGRDDGVVRVEFVSTTNSWTCMVSDNGVGVANKVGMSDKSVGVGSKILATLLSALGAELVVKSGPGGTSSVVRCQFQPECVTKATSSNHCRPAQYSTAHS